MNEVAEITKDKLTSYLDVVGVSGLTEKEKMQFIEICSAFGLNPFKREVYITAYGEGQYRKLSIIVGYETYIKRAEKSGLLEGWKVWTESDKAIIEIHRKDWKMPFTHEVLLDEYIQRTKDGKPTNFWATKPMTMLKKVAISQGFRLCFSVELGGMPYTEDELPPKETYIDVTPSKTDIKTEELVSPAQIKKIFATATEKKVSNDEIKDFMLNKFTKTSTKELTKEEAKQLIEYLTELSHEEE
jgi:phage recombination protein Bet